MNPRGSRRKTRILVLSIVIVAGGIGVLFYVASRKPQPAPIQPSQEQPPANTGQAEAAPSAAQGPEPAQEALSGAINEAAEDADRRIAFIQESLASHIPSEKREKVLQILSRFLENFALIESAKLKEKETFHKIAGSEAPGLDDYIERMNKTGGRDLAIECSRAPLSFKLSGMLSGQQVDSSAGTGGWVITPAGEVPVETAVQLYIDWGVTEFQANDLKYDLAIQEDVPLDGDFLKLDAVKEFIPDPRARFDVLKIYERDFEGSEWINRETGMLEYRLAKLQNPEERKPPFFLAFIFTYQKAGDICYLKTVQGFAPAQGLPGAAKGPLERGFQIRIERTFTGVEINGVPAQ